MLFLVLLLLGTPDDPPRPTGATIVTKQPLIDLQSCITRHFARSGTVTPIPLPDGVALDYSMRASLFAPPGKATLTFEIHEQGEQRLITAGYRHPWPRKAAIRGMKEAQKSCVADGVLTDSQATQ
jgi:hypothetical protein